jgi:mannosyltransferase OCH1-like enzyme
LLAVVGEWPDYTAAAMLLLVTARRQGAFAHPRKAGAASGIPKTIVQFWDAPEPPPDIEDLSRSWRQHNPGFAYERFDRARAGAYILSMGRHDVLQAFQRAREPAMMADLFRLTYLFHSGGVYADADDRCRKSLAPLLETSGDLVLYQENIGSTGNNFIAAAPGDPVLGQALESGTEAVCRGDNDTIWLSTGPGLLTRSLARYLSAERESWRQRLHGISVLDRHELLDYVAIHCLTSYKHTRKNWLRSSFPARARAKASP